MPEPANAGTPTFLQDLADAIRAAAAARRERVLASRAHDETRHLLAEADGKAHDADRALHRILGRMQDAEISRLGGLPAPEGLG